MCRTFMLWAFWFNYPSLSENVHGSCPCGILKNWRWVELEIFSEMKTNDYDVIDWKWAFYRMELFLCMTRRKSCLILSTLYRSSSSIRSRIASKSLFWQSRKKQSYWATCQLFNLYREIISTYIPLSKWKNFHSQSAYEEKNCPM